jgi:hypothetical protein
MSDTTALAELRSEYDAVCDDIDRLEQQIAEFEERHRDVFNAHRDLCLQLSNARHHEDRLSYDVFDAQRAMDDEA